MHWNMSSDDVEENDAMKRMSKSDGKEVDTFKLAPFNPSSDQIQQKALWNF